MLCLPMFGILLNSYASVSCLRKRQMSDLVLYRGQFGGTLHCPDKLPCACMPVANKRRKLGKWPSWQDVPANAVPPVVDSVNSQDPAFSEHERTRASSAVANAAQLSISTLMVQCSCAGKCGASAVV